MAIYRIVFFLILSHIGLKSSRVLTTLYAIELGADSLVIGFLISMYGLFPDLYSFYFPIYGHSIGFSATLIGIVLSLYAAAAFVIRIAMPFVVKKYNEEKVLTFSLLLSGATFLFFPFFENVVMLSLISFIIGLGLGCGQPLSIIMTYNRAPAGRSGEALGARITINKFIQMIVPILFGSLGNIFGLLPVFWSNALLLIGGGYMNNHKRNR